MSVNIRLNLPNYVTANMLKNTINKILGSLINNNDDLTLFYNNVSFGYGSSCNDKKNELKDLYENQMEQEGSTSKILANITKSNILKIKEEIDLLEKISNKNKAININERWSSCDTSFMHIHINPFEEKVFIRSLFFDEYKIEDEIIPKQKMGVYLNPGSNFHWALIGHRCVEMFGGKIVWSDSSDNDNPKNYMIIETKDALYKPNKRKDKVYNENLFKNALLNLKSIDEDLINKITNEIGFGENEEGLAILRAMEKTENLKVKIELENTILNNSDDRQKRAKKIKF